MELTVIERMLFGELLAQRRAALAPIDARIAAAVAAVAERVGLPAQACAVDLTTGTIKDLRAVDAGADQERLAEVPS